ncbi:GNAT family N-acetyltransferase [Shouchella clausii]|uniref:GNAT family N-acetyltransferase n=1 Tax=Shouchella clausii TaxID=79880 RepID=UPI002704BF43|nr:GNAT family N-acetyltransferase [Shouchella clausii]MDO7269289.1 GNAT family N-acetyltransferase [Shouchella clausii]MDO7289171.1 GNAT family N-acetyltransferase [Shouchella clausii]
MLFQNGKLLVRQLESKDNFLLAKWLSDPLVLKYYEGRDNPFDLEKVNKKFYQHEIGVYRCIVEFDNIEIGYIQFYRLDHEERKLYEYVDIPDVIYGMDQFIGETNYWNRGIGTLLVKSMVAFLVEQKQADRVVMDPQTWNERAIRCYEKCGFERVKLLPKNELHEGEYRDCWLIEYH